MSEQWLNDIRHKVSQHKEPAPVFSAGEWKAIAASLPAKKAVPFPFWARAAAAAAILVGALGIGFRMLQPQAPERIAASLYPVQLEYPEYLSRPMETPSEAFSPIIREVPSPTPQESIIPEPVMEPVMEPVTEPAKEPAKESMVPPETFPEVWEQPAERRHRSRLAAQAFVSGTIGAQSTSAPRLMSASVIGVNALQERKAGALEMNGGTQIDVRHRLPIRAGITFSCDLGRGWGVESGLAVSFHSSEFKTPSATKNQELLFIGIPLNVNYRFCEWNRLSLYVSAGGLMEKMVSGSGYITETGYREKIEMRPLQFSVQASIGLDYRLSERLSLYAEPGLRYSFNNGSGVSTLYTDRPFDGNLTMGLRVHF